MNNNLKLKNLVSVEDFQILIAKLYIKYPQIIRTKVSEYQKTFSAENPFFKYGKISSYFLVKDEEIVGHIAAIFDDRFGSIGTLGFFECENNMDYASILFEEANKYLKEVGKKESRGPINVSVWQNFRVSYPEINLPFFLEPFTLEYYKDLFLGCGFIVNHKNITTIGSVDQSKLKSYETFYTDSIKNGYSYELLNKDNSKEIIKNIFLLINQVFEKGYSFYKISEEEFFYFTQQYTELVKPYYIFVIKDEKQELVGFFFAVPDLFNPNLKRVVLKTMGIAPKFRGLGLAEAMFYFVYKKSKEDGFSDLIYSTVEIGNERIKSLVGESAVLYRQYEVYSKNLL